MRPAIQGERGRFEALVLVGAVLLAGCGTGATALAPEATVAVRQRRVLADQSFYETGEKALRDYQELLRQKRQALGQLPQEEQREEDEALRRMEVWLLRQEAQALTKRFALEVYVDFQVEVRAEAKREAARRAAVEEKLEEYLDWAQAMAARMERQRVQRVGREYWATDSQALQGARHEVVSAVLAWGLRHTEDPDFLRKSPSEVAVYLLATRSALATALALGHAAPGSVEYTRLSEKTREEEEEDEERELVVGLTPVLGEVVDFTALVTGYNVAGRRYLEEDERLLCAVGMVVPVLPGRAVGLGGKALREVALVTGRSVDEVYTMARVVQQLAPGEARALERLTRKYARGGELTQVERDFLRRTARGVEEPLRQMREAFERGRKVPLLAVRTDEAGLRLVPGSPEHRAQAWVEYQFRHSREYPRFRYEPDEKWKRLYQQVLENKGKGGAFEQDVLKQRGLRKNTALLLSPPGSKAQGFAPDSVPGNSNPGELVWGKPYNFFEAKAQKELSLTGNLKSMIEYVAQYGGHIELCIRSAKHRDGPTRLSAPLVDRLRNLIENGQAHIRYHP